MSVKNSSENLKDPSETIKYAIEHLNIIKDTVTKYKEYTKKVDEKLYNRLVDFNAKYSEFLLDVIRYSMKIKHIVESGLRYIDKDVPSALVSCAKFEAHNPQNLIETAETLKTEAHEINSNLTLSKIAQGLEWYELLTVSLASVGVIAITIMALPLATTTEVFIGVGIVFSLIIFVTFVYGKLKKMGINETEIEKIKNQLVKIEKQMKDIAMNLTENEATKDNINDLSNDYKILPDSVKEILKDDIKTKVEEMLHNCNELILLAKNNYFEM